MGQQKKLEVVKESMLEEDEDHGKNTETMQKREQLKAMLERQGEIEEKRTMEQNKIALAREKLLELKLKELNLQKAKLERAQREQEEKKRATNDFMAGIEAELEDMEAKAKAPLVEQLEKQMGAVPKKGKGKGKGRKSKSNTPKVMSPEPKTPKVLSPAPETQGKNKEVKMLQLDDEQEKGEMNEAMAKSERRKMIIKKMEQIDKEKPEDQDKMSEVKEMVKNVEGKCQTVRGDIANMAMSEQYLRTKQALLMAKKKEQEMKIASNIASIREQEVIKMREKVKSMQD